MKKSKKVTVILMIVALLSGCSAVRTNNKAEQIDFQEKMELKIPDPAVSNQPRILFVGNSYTFYNNMSGMFVNIVKATGHKSKVYELSTGYYSLKRYADTEDQGGALLEQTLTQQDWDFVILQENTTKALTGSAENEMFPSARILDEKIKSAGAQTTFLMTWAPKDGMKSGMKKRNCEDIQSDLASNYITIANELDGLLIPAGIGFMRCKDLYPDIELWDSDGQHPSQAGSYLVACITYAVVFQESPENCTYYADLDEESALCLQKIAADMILE